MNEYLILQKELELEELRYVNEFTLYNELYGNYITESEESLSDFITKTFEAAKEFIKKIKDRLVAFFTRSKKEELNKKISLIENNKELKNKKVKIPNYDKLEKLQKDTLKKIKEAKSSERIQNVIAYYKENKTIILTSASFMVTLGFVAHAAKERINEMDHSLQGTLKIVDAIEKQYLKAASALDYEDFDRLGLNPNIHNNIVKDQTMSEGTILTDIPSMKIKSITDYAHIINEAITGFLKKKQ